MKYKYLLGQYIIYIDDAYGLIHTSTQFFDTINDDEKYDLLCRIERISELKGIPKGLLNMKNKLIEGEINGKSYSILVNRRIAIVSDAEQEKITIYADDNSICDFSIYSMFICFKKHAAFLLCRDNRHLVLHGAVVYHPKKNEAYLIVGESGGGKSTISWTFIQSGFDLISDDLAVVDCIDGRVNGGGGFLFVTEDFVQRYDISKYDVVSPGRKMKIEVPQYHKGNVPISKIMIASGVLNEQSRIIVDEPNKMKKIYNSQKGWAFYEKKGEECRKILRDISKGADVYEVFVNDSLQDFVGEIIEDNKDVWKRENMGSD